MNQTAATSRLKADKLAVRQSPQVHVVGVQIYIVLRQDHYRGFEHAANAGLTEDRLFIGGIHLLLIEPDLRIGAVRGSKDVRRSSSLLVGFSMQLNSYGLEVHSTLRFMSLAVCQRIQPHRVQHLVHRLTFFFRMPWNWRVWRFGQTDTAINRVIRREFIDRLPLRRSNHPARQAAAQQHLRGAARLPPHARREYRGHPADTCHESASEVVCL